MLTLAFVDLFLFECLGVCCCCCCLENADLLDLLSRAALLNTQTPPLHINQHTVQLRGDAGGEQDARMRGVDGGGWGCCLEVYDVIKNVWWIPVL